MDRRAFARDFLTVLAGELRADVEEAAARAGRRVRVGDFDRTTFGVALFGTLFTAADGARAARALQVAARRVAAFCEPYDLLLTPTLATPPPVFNVTGQPAMSVPLHWTPGGLPVGMHFVARSGDEATLFRLAAQLEEARPWAGRMPPGFE